MSPKMLIQWTTHLHGIEHRLHNTIESAMKHQELRLDSTLAMELSRIRTDLCKQIEATQKKGTNHYKLPADTENANLLGLLGVFEQDQYYKKHGDFYDDNYSDDNCADDH
jgi:hypothetical protein